MKIFNLVSRKKGFIGQTGRKRRGECPIGRLYRTNWMGKKRRMSNRKGLSAEPNGKEGKSVR
ncbi:hypothetical protein DYI25_18775 [Mesobacillus boroniphilus]|uniref:Uncharacterized protein n=1 Tax=Mesobacillus boroniphilus TaxID=308892 RepID=A0A944GY89_9BACI|nr:hypothetical protein [Mesobacillus boroniphilus]